MAPREVNGQTSLSIAKGLLDRHTGLTAPRDTNDVITELSRIRPRHNNILPACPPGKPTQMSPTVQQTRTTAATSQVRQDATTAWARIAPNTARRCCW